MKDEVNEERRIIDCFCYYTAMVQSYIFESEYNKKSSKETKETIDKITKTYVDQFNLFWIRHTKQALTELDFRYYNVLEYLFNITEMNLYIYIFK
ncbi:MAG: hypothetical protein GF317_23140 [Candidatus Lokiarchaeota archaeon]|nr:hypothetical protein [Candidatus Lokiarchaeota archaeon]